VVAAEPRRQDSVFIQGSMPWSGNGEDGSAVTPFNLAAEEMESVDGESESGGFRTRLRAIDLR